MAKDLVVGERVTANHGFLACPNCDGNANAVHEAGSDHGIYGTHRTATGKSCRGGHRVPKDIEVRRVWRKGEVVYIDPLNPVLIQVLWDDEPFDKRGNPMNLKSYDVQRIGEQP